MILRDLYAPFLGFDDPAETGIIDRLRRGDPRAVAEVYDAHHASVRGFARRLLGDDAAAEDLVHEVFVTLPSAIRHFDGASRLGTYLISIAANHARHFLRAAARRRRAFARLALEPAAFPDTPEHEVSRWDLARALTRALDTLPLDQRLAVVLCEVEERSSRAAAENAPVAGGPVRN